MQSMTDQSTSEQFVIFQIPMAVNAFKYYAGYADKIEGKTVNCDGLQCLSYHR